VRDGKFACMAIAILARNLHGLAAQVDTAPPARHFPAASKAAIGSVAEFPGEQFDFGLCEGPNLGFGRFLITHSNVCPVASRRTVSPLFLHADSVL
jgi:hypothetical protein